MTHNEISGIIIEVAIKIHKELGPGLLESVYQKIMVYELRKRGLTVVEEVSVPIEWDGIQFDEGFRADFVVDGKVMVELKSVEANTPVFKKKLLT
jgi:GxxExxY protein